MMTTMTGTVHHNHPRPDQPVDGTYTKVDVLTLMWDCFGMYVRRAQKWISFQHGGWSNGTGWLWTGTLAFSWRGMGLVFSSYGQISMGYPHDFQDVIQDGFRYDHSSKKQMATVPRFYTCHPFCKMHVKMCSDINESITVWLGESPPGLHVCTICFELKSSSQCYRSYCGRKGGVGESWDGADCKVTLVSLRAVLVFTDQYFWKALGEYVMLTFASLLEHMWAQYHIYTLLNQLCLTAQHMPK